MPKLNEGSIIDPIEEEDNMKRAAIENSEFSDPECADWHDGTDAEVNATMTPEDFEDIANEIEAAETVRARTNDSFQASLNDLMTEEDRVMLGIKPDSEYDDDSIEIEEDPDTQDLRTTDHPERLIGRVEDRFEEEEV